MLLDRQHRGTTPVAVANANRSQHKLVKSRHERLLIVKIN